MFFAINSKTGENVDSLTIEENPSYQFPKEEIWYADPDEIKNCPKEKDIKKIEVRFRTGATDVTNWKGTKYDISPHFFIPNRKKLKINIIPESKEHKQGKNWIYNILKKEKLLINYSKVNKPYPYENQIKLFDLKIDKEKIGLETNCGYFGGIKSRIADVICPFQKVHPLFNTGIVFEIQFSKMMKRTKTDREMDWALKGYSVVWLFKEDFEEISDSNIVLKKDSVNVDSNLSLLKFYKKSIMKTFKVEIQEEVRKLKITQNNFKEECDKIESKTELLYREKEKQINDFLDNRLKELGKNFNEEIIKRIQKDFFINNKEDLKNILQEVSKEIIEIEITEDFIKKIIKEIDYKSIIEEKITKDLKIFFNWKRLLSDAPHCPYCKSAPLKPIYTKKGKWAYVCENEACKKWTNLPREIEEKMRFEEW